MTKIKDKKLQEELTEFVKFVLKKSKIKHHGNCLAMCQILKPYVYSLYEIDVLIKNTTVKQHNKEINHYYLLRVSDGAIIDATSAQFKFPNGKQMPQVYIGKKPDFYS